VLLSCALVLRNIQALEKNTRSVMLKRLNLNKLRRLDMADMVTNSDGLSWGEYNWKPRLAAKAEAQLYAFNFLIAADRQ